MLLPFHDRLMWTHHLDPEMAALADRHYPRRKESIGKLRFSYSGRKLVLRNAEGTVLWVWMFPDPAMRMDGQLGYNCSLFRNESRRRASEIILEAEAWAFDKWGPARLYTYIDPDKIRVVKCRGVPLPGFCFLKAGWKFVREIRDGKLLFAKERDKTLAPA
jgi:hypothetical protein